MELSATLVIVAQWVQVPPGQLVSSMEQFWPRLLCCCSSSLLAHLRKQQKMPNYSAPAMHEGGPSGVSGPWFSSWSLP